MQCSSGKGNNGVEGNSETIRAATPTGAPGLGKAVSSEGGPVCVSAPQGWGQGSEQLGQGHPRDAKGRAAPRSQAGDAVFQEAWGAEHPGKENYS